MGEETDSRCARRGRGKPDAPKRRVARDGCASGPLTGSLSDMKSLAKLVREAELVEAGGSDPKTNALTLQIKAAASKCFEALGDLDPAAADRHFLALQEAYRQLLVRIAAARRRARET
jgi:hypothetical protein